MADRTPMLGVSRAQHRMQDMLDGLVARGQARGLQVAAYVDGRLVVDAWAGVADAATGRAVDGDTLFPVFSTTKGMMATVIHRLVERGRLDYDWPIARVWPEFAANGKAAITLRQALAHMAGIPQMPGGIGRADLGDWDRMCAAVAGLTPQWKPGSNMAYHAVTFSWILGEAARRVDGRPVSQMIRDEIARPLGIEDLYVGLPDELDPRVAVLEDPGATPAPDDGKPQAIPSWITPLAVWMNHPAARRACIPASNGIMSARAIARHYAALLPGGVDGVELLPPARVRQATALQHVDGDPSGEPPMRMGLGYHVGGPGSGLGPRVTAFGHGGHGGSMGFADPEYRLAVGFTRNLFAVPPDAPNVIDELRAVLGVPSTSGGRLADLNRDDRQRLAQIGG